MKYLLYFIVIVLLLSLNAGLFAYLKIAGAAPNLLLLLVVVSALEKDSNDFFFLAFFSGLILDFYTGIFFGSFTLAFLLTGFLIQMLVNHVLIFEVSWKYLIAIFLGAAAAVDCLLVLFNLGAVKLNWTAYALDYRLIFRRLPIELFYDLLLLYPVYRFSAFVQDFNKRWLAKQSK